MLTRSLQIHSFKMFITPKKLQYRYIASFIISNSSQQHIVKCKLRKCSLHCRHVAKDQRQILCILRVSKENTIEKLQPIHFMFDSKKKQFSKETQRKVQNLPIFIIKITKVLPLLYTQRFIKYKWVIMIFVYMLVANQIRLF